MATTSRKASVQISLGGASATDPNPPETTSRKASVQISTGGASATNLNPPETTSRKGSVQISTGGASATDPNAPETTSRRASVQISTGGASATNSNPPEQQSRQVSGNASKHSTRAGSVAPSIQQESRKESKRGTENVSTASTITRKSGFETDDGTCSMVIICEGKKLYCHKDFLCIWSPVMKQKCYPDHSTAANQKSEQANGDIEPETEMMGEPTINSDGLVEIELEEGNYEEMKEFLQCLYPPHKEVTDENVDEVVALASEFKTEQLRNKCEEILLSREATLDLMLTAETLELTKLKEDVAKRLALKSLESVEKDPAFEELGEESKMMIWREMAVNLESQQDHIDDISEKINGLGKFVLRKHACKKIPEDKFTSVTQFTEDARGRKVKETIPNATLLKLGEEDAECKFCVRTFGKNVLEKITQLDELKMFEKAKEKDNVTHIHFHPKM